MANNNTISTKLKFQDLPTVPANQKLTATEFNQLTGFQKSPVQQIAGSLDDTDIIIDGTKNYATTIVVAGATRTITANGSGHSQGNNIKQRYTFDIDCTITLSGFDTPGNNTGNITPIPAGTYDFQYFSNRNGVNVEIAQNTNVANFTEPGTWYVHSAPKGNDANIGSANFPFENLQVAHDALSDGDIVVIQDTAYNKSAAFAFSKSFTLRGPSGYNTISAAKIGGQITITAGANFTFQNININAVTFISTVATSNVACINCRVSISAATDGQIELEMYGGDYEGFAGLKLRSVLMQGIEGGVGNLETYRAFTIYNSFFSGNVNVGTDVVADLIMGNSTIFGNAIVSGDLQKYNSVISGTETVSGTTTSRQAKVFDDPVEFKGQAHANTGDNAIKTFTATPTFDVDADGNDQQIPVEGNITSVTVVNQKGSANYDLWFVNDGTPGRTVATPTGWLLIPGGDTHDDSASAINLYQLKTNPDATIKKYIIKNM